jgi:predicted transcriptional regulator
VLSIDGVAAWKETIQILSDRKASSALDQGLAEIASGETVSLEEIRSELRALRTRAGRPPHSRVDATD